MFGSTEKVSHLLFLFWKFASLDSEPVFRFSASLASALYLFLFASEFFAVRKRQTRRLRRNSKSALKAAAQANLFARTGAEGTFAIYSGVLCWMRGEVSGRKIRPAAANDAASEARSPFRAEA